MERIGRAVAVEGTRLQIERPGCGKSKHQTSRCQPVNVSRTASTSTACQGCGGAREQGDPRRKFVCCLALRVYSSHTTIRGTGRNLAGAPAKKVSPARVTIIGFPSAEGRRVVDRTCKG